MKHPISFETFLPAKTVLEYGAQDTSPTGPSISNMNRGELQLKETVIANPMLVYHNDDYEHNLLHWQLPDVPHLDHPLSGAGDEDGGDVGVPHDGVYRGVVSMECCQEL